MERFLVILAGLPSSGKTTIAQAMKTHFPADLPAPCPAITIIDPDRFRGEKGEQLEFHPEDEPKIKQKVIEEAARQLQAGLITIIDDLNYYQSMRHDLLQLALLNNVPFLLIFVNTPLETCLRWNERRGMKIPNKLIEKIAHKFDYFERYAWDQPDFTIDPSYPDFDLQAFIRQLSEFLKDHISRRPQLLSKSRIRSTQPPSTKELLDIRSRKIISEFNQNRMLLGQQQEITKLRKALLRKNPANLEEVEQFLEEFRNVLKSHALKNED